MLATITVAVDSIVVTFLGEAIRDERINHVVRGDVAGVLPLFNPVPTILRWPWCVVATRPVVGWELRHWVGFVVGYWHNRLPHTDGFGGFASSLRSFSLADLHAAFSDRPRFGASRLPRPYRTVM